MTNVGFSYLVSRLEREGSIFVTGASLSDVRESLKKAGVKFSEGIDEFYSDGSYLGRYIYV